MFLDRRHQRFGNFNSAVPADVVRVKSYVDSFLDPTGVLVRVSTNKLHLVPTTAVVCDGNYDRGNPGRGRRRKAGKVNLKTGDGYVLKKGFNITFIVVMAYLDWLVTSSLKASTTEKFHGTNFFSCTV